MDPIIGAGLISSGASLMNSILGSTSSANLNAANRDFQREMASTAYQNQRDLTEDTFQLQKQGMINAGISPAAMLGYSGGTASLSSYQASPSNIPEYTPFDINSVLQAVQTANDTKVADSQAAKNYADADKSSKEAGRYNELTDATLKEINSRVGLNEQQAKNLSASVPLLNNQSDYYNWLASQQQLVYQKSAATYQSDIDRIKAENKCSQKEAEKRLQLADDIAEAQLNLTYAQIYNARASGQAQLSNAYTNRLQYKLDAALNTYLQTYYKESAGKLHQESVSEDTLRASNLKLLENDAALKSAQTTYQGLENANYDLDKTVDNASKVIGSVTGAATSLSNAKSNRINAIANDYRSQYPSQKRVDVYHHSKR